MPPIKCPFCHHSTHSIKMISHYGLPIQANQCFECGGIWLKEGDDLYRVKLGEAQKIEDKVKPNSSQQFIFSRPLECPIDNTILKSIRDNFFSDNSAFVCPSCKGVGLRQGAFSRFQKLRAQLQKELSKTKERQYSPEEKQFVKKIDQMLKEQSSASFYQALGKVGKILNQPVHPSEEKGWWSNIFYRIVRWLRF